MSSHALQCRTQRCSVTSLNQVVAFRLYLSKSLGIVTTAGNKEAQLVISDIKMHSLYYFYYRGEHVAHNVINLEFHGGLQLQFQVKIRLKISTDGSPLTKIMLKEKLKNGTFIEYDSKDLENYWIPRIFGLEILSNSIELLDITAGGSAGDKSKIGFK